MRRDFLKGLGIEDKDIIDKIMDENSADIGKAKGELETYKTRVNDLENEIKTKDSTISTLQTKADTVDGLTQRISQLESDKATLTTELNTKVTQIQKTHAIESGVRDAKARNIKAVMALLDMEKITFENGELGGLSEQLDALKGGEDTGFMFGETKPAPPTGTQPNDPPGGNGGTPPMASTLAEAVTKALGGKN